MQLLQKDYINFVQNADSKIRGGKHRPHECKIIRKYKKTKTSITISFDNVLKDSMYKINNNIEEKFGLSIKKYKPADLKEGVALRIKQSIFCIDIHIRVEE